MFPQLKAMLLKRSLNKLIRLVFFLHRERGRHFHIGDFEEMGRHFCEVLLEYSEAKNGNR